MLLNVSYIFDGIMDYSCNKYLVYKCVNFNIVTSHIVIKPIFIIRSYLKIVLK